MCAGTKAVAGLKEGTSYMDVQGQGNPLPGMAPKYQMEVRMEWPQAETE